MWICCMFSLESCIWSIVTLGFSNKYLLFWGFPDSSVGLWRCPQYPKYPHLWIRKLTSAMDKCHACSMEVRLRVSRDGGRSPLLSVPAFLLLTFSMAFSLSFSASSHFCRLMLFLMFLTSHKMVYALLLCLKTLLSFSFRWISHLHAVLKIL